MYYESARKTYYRFPSLSSIQDFDKHHYYPDKPYSSGENLRFQSQYGEYEHSLEGYEDHTDIF